jgi:threonine dehydratase
LQIQNRQEGATIAHSFSEAGFSTIDLTDDELAKLHIRHLVGGRSELAKNERLFRFEFPERPGALMRFLSSMAPDWNISLFHYRNHGADYGRILMGLQVPVIEETEFQNFLTTIGYQYWDETDHPAYKLFLGPK